MNFLTFYFYLIYNVLMTNYLIVCDGGARGNPGPAASGFVIVVDDQPIYQAGYYWGLKTNNQAEYYAVITALTWLSQQPLKAGDLVVVRSDSQLVVNQVVGNYKVKVAHLRPLVSQVLSLSQDIKSKGVNLTFNHQLRRHTDLADALVNQVLDLVQSL